MSNGSLRIVALLLVSVLLIGTYFWGQSGGVVQQQVDSVRDTEAMLRQKLTNPKFQVQHLVCSWPRVHGGQPDFTIAIDGAREKLLFLIGNGEGSDLGPVEEDLVSVDLIEDGASVGRVSRVQQAGAALLGGALAGAPGAIIGGLSTGASSTSSITRVALLISVDVDGKPFSIDFPFWDARSTNGWANLDDDAIRRKRAEARRWLALLQDAMQNAATRARR